MAETTKPIITQEKETETKEIKLDFWRAIQERRELALMEEEVALIKEEEQEEINERESNAREYIRKVNRRKAQKRQAKENLVTNVVCVIILILGISVGLSVVSAKGSSRQSSIYTMQGELQGNHIVLSDGNAHEVGKEYANYTSEPKQVTVTLNDNGTEEVTDDIILDIR